VRSIINQLKADFALPSMAEPAGDIA
jgi:hypothetical protein